MPRAVKVGLQACRLRRACRQIASVWGGLVGGSAAPQAARASRTLARTRRAPSRPRLCAGPAGGPRSARRTSCRCVLPRAGNDLLRRRRCRSHRLLLPRRQSGDLPPLAAAGHPVAGCLLAFDVAEPDEEAGPERHQDLAGRGGGAARATVRLSQVQLSVPMYRARTDPVRRSPRSIRPVRSSRRCSRVSDADRRSQVP
jgi:hypothetical protein